MCLVQAWNTGLEAKIIALLLSHDRVGDPDIEMPKSLNNCLSQESLADEKTGDQYFNSMLYLEIGFAFWRTNRPSWRQKRCKCR